MKKIIFSVTALILASTLALLAGCTGATPLTFNNAYNNKTEAPVGYTETVTYTVTDKEYGDYKIDDEVTDELLKFDFNGTATTTLKVLGSISDFNIETDLDFSGTGRNKYYYFKSELNLTATYTTSGKVNGTPTDNGDGSKSFNDSIVSEALFFMSGQSLSPIWSKTDAKYTYLTADNQATLQVNVNVIEHHSETVYNTATYTIEKSHKTNDGEKVESTVTYAYVQKTAIDSNALLFAVRNIEVSENSNYSMPAISPTYGLPKTLSVKNNGEKQLTLNATYNGVKIENKSVAVKDYTYAISSDTNSGAQKYVAVQKSEITNLPNKALVIEYAEPLSIYGTFYCIGALVYTINTITVTE